MRRKFFDEHATNPSPLTTEALNRIGALYSIEDIIRGLPPDERRRIRQEQAALLLAAMEVMARNDFAELFRPISPRPCVISSADGPA